MIVDTHAHIFPALRGKVASGPTYGVGYGRITAGRETIRLLPPYCEETKYTPEMLLENMDWAGVDWAVLLQGPFYGEHNSYVAEAVSRHPDRLRAAAYLDPWESGGQEMLDRVIETGSFVAVKLECSESSGYCGIYPEARLDSAALCWVWEKLQSHHLTLVLDLGAVGSRSYQTQAVRAIAENYPELKIVIAHLAQLRPAIEIDLENRRLWEEQINLGRLPNVWFDCAALPAYLPDEDYPFPTAGRYLREAIERIGPSKIMWGSDQPGLLSVASLPQLAKMAKLHTEFLPQDEQAMILGETAGKVFNSNSF